MEIAFREEAVNSMTKIADSLEEITAGLKNFSDMTEEISQSSNIKFIAGIHKKHYDTYHIFRSLTEVVSEARDGLRKGLIE